MRAAAFLAAAIIAAGIYLAIASVLNLSPSWMGIGTLVIALLAAIGVMAGEPASSPRLEG